MFCPLRRDRGSLGLHTDRFERAVHLMSAKNGQIIIRIFGNANIRGPYY